MMHGDESFEGSGEKTATFREIAESRARGQVPTVNRSERHVVPPNPATSSTGASGRYDVAEAPSATVGTPSSSEVSEFKGDDNKSWWMFGMGAIDTSGRGAGPAWVPDEAITNCTGCDVLFDWWTRKHHCRYCGKIFCGDCSATFMLLPVSFGVREPQRVCQPCAESLAPMQEQLVSTISNSTRTTYFDPDSISKILASPVSFSMSAEIRKATHSVENFFDYCPNAMIKDQYIPATLLKQAKGIAFLTVFKAGFLFSGRFGTGIVLGMSGANQWSAPTAIGTVGMGWGAQIGGEVTDFVIILNTQNALDAFSGTGQVSLGAELGLALGPMGRNGEASVNLGDGGVAPCYTYSQSKGLFAGVSLEGAVISERSDVNQRFYGKTYSPKELLSGAVPPPIAAEPLYKSLTEALKKEPEQPQGLFI